MLIEISQQFPSSERHHLSSICTSRATSTGRSTEVRTLNLSKAVAVVHVPSCSIDQPTLCDTP